jgi:lipopolysaccharide export LptBFGC system permease protein LptF
MTTGSSPVAGPQRIKQGKSSLVGGIAVGIAALVLWTAIAHELAADNIPTIIVGMLVAGGIGAWIRIADL